MVERLLPLIVVALMGCALPPSAAAPARLVTVQVPVPQPVYCKAPAPSYPRLPIASLNGASKTADTMRAYAASVIILKGLVRERDEVIAGCKKPSGESRVSSVAARQ
jgi:hypothetical protein